MDRLQTVHPACTEANAIRQENDEEHPYLLDSALEYAIGAGWPIFPCAPGTKVPLFHNPHPAGSPERARCAGECGRDGHGVKDATTDPDRITAWWTRCPTANIGIATGAPGPDVVDIDTKNGAPGMASFTTLRDAGLLGGAFMAINTPTGGLHLYYLGSSQGNGCIRNKGIDFRGKGGYVLAAPSTVGGAAYTLESHRETGGPVDFAAIRRLLEPPPVRTGWRPSPGNYTGLIRKVEQTREGNRNNVLYWAACRAAETGANEGVFRALIDASVGNGLPERAAEATVKSAIGKIWGAA